MKKMEVSVHALSMGGRGVAKTPEGQIIFIPYTAPGDVVEVEVLEDKNNHLVGKCLKVLVPSPFRSDPKCEVYGTCGGCQLQHMTYESQVQCKDQMLRQAFERSFREIVVPFKPFVPCPMPFSYRHRIQLKIQEDQWGYYQSKTHRLVPIQVCPIAAEKINHFLLKKGESHSLSHPSQLASPSQRLEIGLDEKNEIYTLDPEKDNFFTQVNPNMNDILQKSILQEVKQNLKTGSSTPFLTDFFAGSGNFSFFLFHEIHSMSLQAVESNPKSVQKAIRYLDEHHISPKRVRFHLSEAENFLRRMKLPKGSMVLLDPPREGTSKAFIQGLFKENINNILYLSCNPATLIRDLLWGFELHHNLPWRISSVQGFDMFPQTGHMEILVSLVIDRA